MMSGWPLESGANVSATKFISGEAAALSVMRAKSLPYSVRLLHFLASISPSRQHPSGWAWLLAGGAARLECRQDFSLHLSPWPHTCPNLGGSSADNVLRPGYHIFKKVLETMFYKEFGKFVMVSVLEKKWPWETQGLLPGNRWEEPLWERWARLCELFDSGFLNFSTTDIGLENLCCGVSPVSFRMVSSTPALFYPLDTRRTLAS